MNNEKLKSTIKDKGLTYVYVANKLGLTYQSLWQKINGKCEFKLSEIAALADTLSLTKKEREVIFFTDV